MEGKKAKTPHITDKTKLLCFDAESNGLHGRVFAIGALIVDMQAKVLNEFTARTELTDQVDEWVKANVLPAIKDMSITHKSYTEMREAFWRWFVMAQEKSDYVLVNNGYPVEYKLLLDCQNADLDARYWQHPFPIIDLSSLLLGLGLLNERSKKKLAGKLAKTNELVSHHPLHDAKATAMIAVEALLLGKQAA